LLCTGHWAFETKRVGQASYASASTPGYEPPEHPLYTDASDVWQLAFCIASVCTATINPWSRRHPEVQKWSKRQPAGRNYSKELNEILSWCLTNDTKHRPMPMEISMRLEAKYEKMNLPPDHQPMVVLGTPDGQAARVPQRLSSSGSQFGIQRPNVRPQRPNLQAHAFSDPGVQRMEHRQDQYVDFVHRQRSPIPTYSKNEATHGGGRKQQPRLPGGFVRLHDLGLLPPGFGQGGECYRSPNIYSAPGRRR
jgi:serine/threonine protein kinase